MKTSVLVPLFNDARNIPALIRSLLQNSKKSRDLEVLFIDNGSTDDTLKLLESAKLPSSKILREPTRGFAEPLNLGLAKSSGDHILFLDAQAVPDSGWAAAMDKALVNNDLVVGQTSSLAPKKKTPYATLATKLFQGHSERSAHARGHALPWGPTSNLGVRRKLLDLVGPFSVEAAGAIDIDWCWRAVLKGARIHYAKDAKVSQARPSERSELLEQFERFGLGEAWLHRTYSFLLSAEDQNANPLLAGVDAFRRLRHGSDAAKIKSLIPALEEVAAAFAGGVRLGYERPHRESRLDRSMPKNAISWWNGPKTKTVFVPSKGLAVLEGKQLQLWEAMQAGEDEEHLTKLFMRLFKAKEAEARHEVEDFRQSLT